jgi:hypothetical protein
MEDVGIVYGHLVYFTDNWKIVWPFGIFYTQFVNFMAIWSIRKFYGHLVYFMCTQSVNFMAIW